MVGTLTREMARREPAQLVIKQGEKIVGSRLVTSCHFVE
jgi:hypothetical protein